MAIGDRMRLNPRSPVLFVWLLLVFSTGQLALAQDLTFRADPAQSQVEFTLGDVLHTVHGTFRLKDSTVQIDPAKGSVSGVIVVDATSGNSGNDSRDHKMHKEILQSDKFPEIRFTLQKMEGTLAPNGNSEIKLSGVMSIHGGDHPMTVTAPVQINNGRTTTDVHFVVPYVQWGMKDPSTFVLRVSKEVDITVHLVGSLSARPAP
jgi:polyisoprenoid-binding protein YceI